MQRNSDSNRFQYLFRRNQILSGDISEFLGCYDPNKLNSFRLRHLFGSLAIELEDAAALGDIPTIPEARSLVLALHRQWPWAGFFLDLARPLGSAQALGGLPILAYGLCLADLHFVAWDRTRECHLWVNQDQLLKFRAECFEAIDELGERAGIPPDQRQGRKAVVGRQLNRLIDTP